MDPKVPKKGEVYTLRKDTRHQIVVTEVSSHPVVGYMIQVHRFTQPYPGSTTINLRLFWSMYESSETYDNQQED